MLTALRITLATACLAAVLGPPLRAAETLPCLRTAGNVSVHKSLGAGLDAGSNPNGLTANANHTDDPEENDVAVFAADSAVFQDGGNYANANYVIEGEVLTAPNTTDLVPQCNASGGLQNFAYSDESQSWAFMFCSVDAWATYEIQSGTSTSTDAELTGAIDVIVAAILDDPGNTNVSFSATAGSSSLNGTYMGPGSGWATDSSSSSSSGGDNFSEYLPVSENVTVGSTVGLRTQYSADLSVNAFWHDERTNWWSISLSAWLEVVQD